MFISITLEPRFMFPRSLSLPAWVMAKLSPDYCHSLLLTMSEEEKRKFLRGADDGLCCHHSLGSRWVLIGGQLCGRGLRRRVLDLVVPFANASHWPLSRQRDPAAAP